MNRDSTALDWMHSSMRRLIGFLFGLITLPAFLLAVILGSRAKDGRFAFNCGRFVAWCLITRNKLAGPYPADLGYETPDDWNNGRKDALNGSRRPLRASGAYRRGWRHGKEELSYTEPKVKYKLFGIIPFPSGIGAFCKFAADHPELKTFGEQRKAYREHKAQ